MVIKPWKKFASMPKVHCDNTTDGSSNRTRYIEGSHSHLVPISCPASAEQGKEIGIEKEDGSNHNHHRTDTLCSQCADILQTEEVDMAETTEPGNLLLLLVINFFVIKIDW